MSFPRSAQPGGWPLQRRGQRQHCSLAHAVRGAAPHAASPAHCQVLHPAACSEHLASKAAQVLSNVAWTVLGSGGLHLPAVNVAALSSSVQRASSSAALPCSFAAAFMLSAAACAVLTCTVWHDGSVLGL